MPAFYAHDRFGAKAAERIDGELKEIITKYYTQFEIGLQGPDIFFFYRPYCANTVTKMGNHMHSVSAYSFFEHALKVVQKRGRKSREYAYLLGFICHFTLDSECHPYVDAMIKETGVQHLEIEEEFEKKLLRLDKENPFSYPIADLVPTDRLTARAIAPFFEEVEWDTVQKSLKWLKVVKYIFTAPHPWKQKLINAGMKMTGKYSYYKGLMHQREDNIQCIESNCGLMKRFNEAIETAAALMQSFDESLTEEKPLNKRFDRNFE